MKFFFSLGVVFFFQLAANAEKQMFTQPTPTQARQWGDSQDLEMMADLHFISEWTSYKYSNESLPKIEVIRHGLVQVFAYGEAKVIEAEGSGKILATVLSVYDADRDTIYFSDQLDEDTRRVALIHELVHYLQDINGYTKSLNGHLVCTESEAYDVQALWQIMNHVKEEQLPGVQEHSLLAAMACMGDQSKAFNQAAFGPKSEFSK